MYGAPSIRHLGGFPRRWLVILFLLVIAWTALWSLKARHGGSSFDAYDNTLPELAVRILPRQVRDLVAGYLWLTADEYIHFGPSRANTGRFLAGAYAGNTEIIPVLEMALFFDPTRIDAYAILGRNLTLFLPRFQDGIRLLQRGVFYNRDDPQLHELFTEIAFNFGFIEDYRTGMRNNRAVGLKYLEAAIRAFKRTNGGLVKTLSIWRPENIQAIQARWLLEAGKKDQALEALKAAGLDQDLNIPLSQDVFRSLGASMTSQRPTPSTYTASVAKTSSSTSSSETGHSEKAESVHDDAEHQHEHQHKHSGHDSTSSSGALFHSFGLMVIAGILLFTSVPGFKPSAKNQ